MRTDVSDLQQVMIDAGLVDEQSVVSANEQQEMSMKLELLEMDQKTGKYLTTPDNYILYINEISKYAGKIKYNEIKHITEVDGECMTDFMMSEIYNDCYRFFKTANKTNLESAFSEIVNANRYNPLSEYLKNVKWDGNSRVSTVFIDWLGAADTKLNRELTLKWFLAAVKRALIPGCQFDNMIVLQCPDGGGGKTTLCKRLALNFGDGEENYYNELTGLDIDDAKIAAEKMNESWIIGFDELDGLKKKDVNNIKTFLSKTEEKVRMAYARNATVNKRHCVFIGSTNDSNFLKDYTSSVERRFWVIPITRNFNTNIVWDGFTREVVDQIWAEAYFLLTQDINQCLDIDKNLYKDLADQQENFKSFNVDADIDFFLDIFEHEYFVGEKGYLVDYQQFKQQLNGTFIQNGFEKGITLDRFPVQWVKQYAVENRISWKGPSYISAATKWEYKVSRVNDKIKNCFVRTNK